MKTLIAVVTVAGVCAAGAWFVAANKKTAEFQKERQTLLDQWQDEKDRLERDLRRAKGQTPRVETVATTVEVPVATKSSPQQILAHLTHMKPAGGEAERIRSIREIIHHLETLADLGPEALPHIRSFLAQNLDVSYEREREREGDNQNNPQGNPQGGGPDRGGPDGRGPGGFRGPGEGDRGDRPDFGALFGGGGGGIRSTQNYYPYSLRMGLFDVIAKIGGPEAEQILLEALSTTGRGVEVYHLDQLLGEKHKAASVAAAKELLSNPLQVANPTRLDERSKEYCYEILRKYEDTSFLATAKLLLLDANGRLDAGAFRYITRVEREASLTTLYQLYRDPRLTNAFEKAALVGAAVPYAGPNATANQMITEAVVTALKSMGQGQGQGQGREAMGGAAFMLLGRLDNGELQPDVIQSRIALLNSLSQTVAANVNPDDRRSAFVQEMIQRTAQNLQRQLDPNAPSAGGGDRRGRGGFFGGPGRGGR